jgi:metabolite-proton symporter
MTTTEVQPQAEVVGMRKIVAASLIGTALETYDLYLYGTAAALIFAPFFFPNADPTAGLLLSLSTFAISFIARPIGAIVFGHFGDRVGRKNMLMISLMLMGLATFAIGLLPTYSAIGVTAPLLLVFLRFVQGFGFGGEYSGAVLIIAEHAPPAKRGFYAGLNNIGPVFGFILSTGIFLFMTNVLDEASFTAWGWRVPFLLSIVLVGVGLYLRLRISESPIFAESAKAGVTSKVPLFSVVKHYPKELLLATGAMILMFAVFYTFSVYTLSYGTSVVGYERSQVLVSVIVAIAISAVSIPGFSALADRVGRRRISLIGTALTILWVFPMFWLIDSGNVILLALALIVLMVLYGMLYGPIAAYLGELFGTSVRFTGMGIAYNVGGILGAALTPIIATLLVSAAGGSWAFCLYLIALGMVSLVCLLLLPETTNVDLTADRAGR